METSTYVVYWTEMVGDEAVPRRLECSHLTQLLQLTASLRKVDALQVATFTEDSNSVGKPGVADPSPDYDWTKRRTTKLRGDP
jgi:hypothetical protein